MLGIYYISCWVLNVGVTLGNMFENGWARAKVGQYKKVFVGYLLYTKKLGLTNIFQMG